MPPGLKPQSFGRDATKERAGTSHISIIDDAGNALAMTTTIEGAFGSHNWAAGFLLNNELTDFSFRPTDAEGRPVANAVGPGKRPRSSMAPTIVFDAKGDVVAVLGSPGGSRIILYVIKTLIALLDWGMDAQQAADLLNFGSQGRGFEIELGATGRVDGLEAQSRSGIVIVPSLMNSGTQSSRSAAIASRAQRTGAAKAPRSGIETAEETNLVTSRAITVVGAGILGLWQALTLARAGHRVRLIEASDGAVRARGEPLCRA